MYFFVLYTSRLLEFNRFARGWKRSRRGTIYLRIDSAGAVWYLNSLDIHVLNASKTEKKKIRPHDICAVDRRGMR